MASTQMTTAAFQVAVLQRLDAILAAVTKATPPTVLTPPSIKK